MNFLLLISLITLMLLGFSFSINLDKENDCGKLIGSFVLNNAKFEQCFVSFLQPIKFCENCIDFFTELNNNYNEAYRDQSCKKDYFDNSFNVLERIHKSSLNIWNDAYCPGCYDNDTQFVQEKIKNVNDCIQHNKVNDTQCIKCKIEYDTVNALYNNLSKNHSGKVCYDIQDSMNQTRIKWSKILHCDKRTADLNAFTTIAVIIAFIPILFYVGLYIYIKRRQLNYETLTTDFENHSNNQQQNIASGISEAEEERQISQVPFSGNRSNYSEPRPSTSKLNLKQNDVFTKIDKTKNKKENIYKKPSYKNTSEFEFTTTDYDDDESMLPIRTDDDDESMLQLTDNDEDKRLITLTDNEDKIIETERTTRDRSHLNKFKSFL